MERTRAGAPMLIALFISVCLPLAMLVVFAQDRPGETLIPAQSPEPPLSDTRLTVHTLLREDVFSGFLAKDMKRFARGEKNIDLLMEQRPTQKANLLAWKGGATLYRAVLAYENHHEEEFQSKYKQALNLLAEAGKLKTGNDGVLPITGGSMVLFAERLPKENQAAAWKQAYDSYLALYKGQAAIIEKLPVHMRGEVLAGLIQSAAHTGHTEEAKQYLDKLFVVLRDTPYEAAAKKWQEDPKTAKITCISCHEDGQLAPRLNKLNKQ